MKREVVISIQGVLAAAGAFLSNKLGILFPLLSLLFTAMVVDYITGMLASKREAIDHPGDPNYGWSSKREPRGSSKR